MSRVLLEANPVAVHPVAEHLQALRCSREPLLAKARPFASTVAWDLL